MREPTVQASPAVTTPPSGASGAGVLAHPILRMAVLTVLYVAAGKLGLSLAIVHASASAVWPPTGLALAALLVLGEHCWPAILLGAFMTNASTTGITGTSLGIAVGNTLEAAVGAQLVRRYAGGTDAFSTAHGVLRFAGFSVPATLLSATIGVGSLAISKLAAWPVIPRIWFTWWLGDLSSALLVAPLLIIWSRGWMLRPARLLEGLLFAAAVLCVGGMVFCGWLPFPHHHYPLEYLSLPLLVWASLRLGPHGAIVGAALVAVMAISGTLRGMGPFIVADPNTSLLLLQGFIATATITSLVLAAAVVQQRRVELALRGSLKEKEVLLKEIHHRVKNNLQVVSSLLSLQSADLREDDAAAMLFRDSQTRIHSMALVHEALYGSANLATVEMAGYIRRLAQQLSATYDVTRRIEVTIDADPVFLEIDHAVPCGLLLNELLSNVFKHAFPGGGLGIVRVELRERGGRVCLRVADCGVGLPPALDLRTATTLGLRLVQALTEQLRAELRIERKNGTTFVLEWPAEVLRAGQLPPG